jgi:multidrug efflux pump subunit AcrA (membrane-fusion protein)
MTKRRVIVIAAVMILLVAAGAAAVMTRSRMSAMAENAPVVPTVRLTKGSLQLTVHLRGDLRASKQQLMLAPAVGGALRILRIADAGQAVKEGDIVLEFDPADQEHALEQAESEVLEAEQEVIKRRADTEAATAQDKVTLLNAESDARRAELDASIEQDLIAGNEFKIRQAALIEAKRALAQTIQDVEARASANKAGLSVLEEKRAKAQMAADRAKQNIESLTIKAPLTGSVAVRENRDAAGGFSFSGMTLPPYRVGDTVNPGAQVMDVFDITGMEVRALVNEQDRANVEPGQTMQAVSNVVPGAALSAKVVSVSGLGRQDRQSGPLRQFEVTLQLDKPNPALLPGTSVQLTATGRKVDNVMLLPRQTVFEREGRPIVYERTATGFETREIKVLHRTESRVAIDGLSEGVEIALISPDSSGSSATKKPAAQPPGPGMAR